MLENCREKIMKKNTAPVNKEARGGRIREIVRVLATSFISLESNYTSLITVTGVEISKRGDRAVIMFTVLPEEKESDALDFLKRKRADFREYVKKESRLARIPFFDFEIDMGEKNRQKIDEISRGI
jgi:ribosome-binding factor A